MNLIIRAAHFAKAAHGDQKRKYSGRPYIEHPMRVAGMIAMHPICTDKGYAPLAFLPDEQMVAVAWLHDVLEDTKVTPAELEKEFGSHITTGVVHLTGTPPTKGMAREDRKRHDFAKIAAAAKEVKIIKLLDRLDNLRDMDGEGDEFLKVYAKESFWLTAALGDADLALKTEIETLAAKLEQPLCDCGEYGSHPCRIYGKP